MKTYNEIYPAERYASKILTYLQKVAAEKPNMYAKTRKRYESLAATMMECSALILSILEEDSLVPESTEEFDELSVSHQDDLRNKFAELNRKFQQADEFSTDHESLPTAPEVRSDVKSPSAEHSNQHIYYATCMKYDEILYSASMLNFGYSEVNQCARLMYLWFHTRFVPEIADPNFVCKIEYLPSWIANFILVFGKYFEENKLSSFETAIHRWCDKVRSGTAGNYAIPYEVFKLDSDLKKGVCQPSDYTISAVVINDLLSSNCLYQLGPGDYAGPVQYDPGEIPRIVNSRNPSLLPKIRTRINKLNQLVAEVRLTPVGEGDIDE